MNPRKRRELRKQQREKQLVSLPKVEEQIAVEEEKDEVKVEEQIVAEKEILVDLEKEVPFVAVEKEPVSETKKNKKLPNKKKEK